MKIAISSPAGRVDKIRLNKGLAFLGGLGHELLLGETLDSEEFWTAGSAELRAAELERFWCDSSIDVVWAARGGFGCAHLLDLLDWGKMAAYEKVLCGHSDLSVLHLAFRAMGVSRTVSGAMPAVEFAEERVASLTEESTLGLLGSSELWGREYFQKCRVLQYGECSGPLYPVTLSVLCSLCGTDYLPDFNGALLVLEDVNESPYRLDAYLNQLKLSGILARLGGMVFGDFKNCGSEEELEYIYTKYKNEINGPVLAGLPFGHCLPRLSLPVAANIRLSVTKSGIDL